MQRMVRGGRQNNPPKGHFRKRATLVLSSLVRSYARTNLWEVTATHGSLRPSDQTAGGSLQRMVRGGHQNKPPGCPFRMAQTYIHVMSLAASDRILRGSKRSGSGQLDARHRRVHARMVASGSFGLFEVGGSCFGRCVRSFRLLDNRNWVIRD